MKKYSFIDIVQKLSGLLDRSNRKKRELLSDGEICAWNCVSDSISTRISYLYDFKHEDEEIRLIECKLALNSAIAVLEEDVLDAGITQFDIEFKRVINDTLIELREISDTFS
jgi:hypothetical protein